MKLLDLSLAGLALIAAPALAQQSNSMTAAEHHTNVHTTRTTAHIHGTVPVQRHRVVHHRRVVRHHPFVRHYPVRHNHHVLKQTKVTTTTRS